MPYARTSLRREKREVRERMRSMGLDYRQIASEFSRSYRLRPRAAWREAYGWSLQEAADKINSFRGNTGLDPGAICGMTAAHLSEYENWPGAGELQTGRKPGPYLIAVLAAIYDCHVSELIDLADRKHLPKADLLVIDTYARPRASDASVVSPEKMQEGLSVNKSGSKNNAQFSDADVVAREELVPRDAPTVIRVELLRQQITSAFTRSGVAGASLDDWEHTAIRYARATRDRPASILITDLSRDLEDLSHLLTRPLPVSAWRRLTLVAAQMSGLMCLTFCILDDRLAFRGWARTARLAGSEAGDPETLSWVLAQEAHGHYYGGDMLEAIDVARHAGEVARVPCAGAALGAALEARAQATLGRNDETRKALARAEDTLSHLSEEDALIPSAFGYNEASYRFHEGNAYTHLRDAKSAFKSQERALALCAPDNYTDWAMTRLDRAECLIYAGQAADGLRYGIETLTSLAQPKRMGIIARRAEAIMQALPLRARNMTAARDFGEQLMALVGTGKAGKPS